MTPLVWILGGSVGLREYVVGLVFFESFFFAGEVLIGGLLGEHDVVARFVLMCDFESVYEKKATIVLDFACV